MKIKLFNYFINLLDVTVGNPLDGLKTSIEGQFENLFIEGPFENLFIEEQFENLLVEGQFEYLLVEDTSFNHESS